MAFIYVVADHEIDLPLEGYTPITFQEVYGRVGGDALGALQFAVEGMYEEQLLLERANSILSWAPTYICTGRCVVISLRGNVQLERALRREAIRRGAYVLDGNGVWVNPDTI